MAVDQEANFKIQADTSQFQTELKKASEEMKDFGKVFSSTLRGAVVSGKSFEDTLRSIALKISSMAFNRAVAPLDNMIAGALSNVLTGGFDSPSSKAVSGTGNSPASGVGIQAMAHSGISLSPGLQSLASASGTSTKGAYKSNAKAPGNVVGQASESDGQRVNIVFNVQASDAASFNRSEGQISSLLARAVQRGQRKL